MLHEPVVTLTDWLLAVECGVLAGLLSRREGRSDRRRAFVAFFMAAGVAPLLGGLVHGVFPDETTTVHRVLWVGTLLAVGAAALAASLAGLAILEPGPGPAHADHRDRTGDPDRPGATRGRDTAPGARPVFRRVRAVLLVLYGFYAGVVLWGVTDFLVAVIGYLPAILFLLVVFGREHARTGHARVRDGVLALLLSLMAAGVQQAGIGLHPVWLDHNALYHLMQAAAFVLLYRCAAWLVEVPQPRVAATPPR